MLQRIAYITANTVMGTIFSFIISLGYSIKVLLILG